MTIVTRTTVTVTTTVRPTQDAIALTLAPVTTVATTTPTPAITTVSKSSTKQGKARSVRAHKAKLHTAVAKAKVFGADQNYAVKGPQLETRRWIVQESGKTVSTSGVLRELSVLGTTGKPQGTGFGPGRPTLMNVEENKKLEIIVRGWVDRDPALGTEGIRSAKVQGGDVSSAEGGNVAGTATRAGEGRRREAVADVMMTDWRTQKAQTPSPDPSKSQANPNTSLPPPQTPNQRPHPPKEPPRQRFPPKIPASDEQTSSQPQPLYVRPGGRKAPDMIG